MSVVGPRYGATCLRPEAVKWEEALEPDDRDPRILGEGPCNLIHESKAKYDQNQYGVWLICRTCAVRLHYAGKKGAPQTAISLGPTPEVVRKVIAELGNTPVDQINANLFNGMIKAEQRRRHLEDRVKATPNKPKEVPGTVPKARSKAPTKARPSKAPESDLSSEWLPVEDPDNPTLDKWNFLMRRLLRHLAEVEAMETDFTDL